MVPLKKKKKKKKSRPIVKDIPYSSVPQVREGHVHVSSEEAFDDHSGVLDSVNVERWYMAPGVKRIKVRDGQVRGMLFLPPGMETRHLVLCKAYSYTK